MVPELEVQKEAQEEHYQLYAYAYEGKCGVTRMEEFHNFVNGGTLQETVAGIKLHRDMNSGKVNFLALSFWNTCPTTSLNSMIG